MGRSRGGAGPAARRVEDTPRAAFQEAEGKQGSHGLFGANELGSQNQVKGRRQEDSNVGGENRACEHEEISATAPTVAIACKKQGFSGMRGGKRRFAQRVAGGHLDSREAGRCKSGPCNWTAAAAPAEL